MATPWRARAHAFSPRLPGPTRPPGWDVSLPSPGRAELAYERWLEDLKDEDRAPGEHLGELITARSRARNGNRYTAGFYRCCGQKAGEQPCRRVPFRHHTGTIQGRGSLRSGGAHEYRWTCCQGWHWEPGCRLGPHPTLPLPIEREISEEVRHRDRVLKDYILGRSWDHGPEFGLVRRFLQESPQFHKVFPFLYDYEWEVVPGRTDKGKGDLIFTNGCGLFVVMEVKWLPEETGRSAQVSRTQRRKKVVQQAIKYARALAKAHPAAEGVIPATFTNDEGGASLEILEDEVIRRR